ncbi:MAG: transglutaminase family protein [Lachnospiraceae bacterium]|nr:transglutaminase family protein [Lachnospiraceae bacterium]
MIQLKFSYQTKIDFSGDVTDHAFLLRCFPIEDHSQQIVDMVHTNFPIVTGGQYSYDGLGNRIYTGRIDRSHDSLDYRVSGSIIRDDSKKIYENPMPCYKYPSELTHADLAMEEFLESLNLTGTDYEKAEIISKALNEYMTYAPGTTGIATSAAEAFKKRKGVCQDYSHIMISLCRLAGIAARYVCGLPLGEGETHAWVEIWHEGSWYGIDPTRGCDADETYIKLCIGRDYSDCPIERGIFKGDAVQSQTVYMKVSYEKEALLA